jgi:hypothetical protein
MADRAVLEIHTCFTAKPGGTIHSAAGDRVPPASERPDIVWKTIVDAQKLHCEIYSVQGEGDMFSP